MNKILDVFSYIVVEVSLKGFVANGEGKAVIRLKPRLQGKHKREEKRTLKKYRCQSSRRL